MNTSYLGLDEHLLCFFAQRYRVRPMIERKVLEFLAGLKYYADYWQRARLYAAMAGFLRREEANDD